MKASRSTSRSISSRYRATGRQNFQEFADAVLANKNIAGYVEAQVDYKLTWLDGEYHGRNR